MKKWWLIGAAALVAVLLFAGSVYMEVKSGLHEESDKAEKAAIREFNLVRITKSEHFYKNEAYEVVEGVDRSGRKMIVWVDSKGRATAQPADSGLNEKEIKEAVRSKYGNVEIIDARLGMEDGQPLWEVVYTDRSGRYTFYYGYFENGKRYVKYSIKDNT
ncbi:DUF5590 domain-containing protein [Fictibacillus iocasae]|uniref:DUF5590 domain-containing protein n=1 Tax=Fictibacillus iocasae TaxID=2715437 RepID=A0ABW2NMA5_9BACL